MYTINEKKLVLLSYICTVAIRYDRITEKSAHRLKMNAFFFGSILNVGVKRLFRENKSTYEDLPLK